MFPRERLDALFEAVRVNDMIDLAATPPADVRIDYTPAEIDTCFRLSRRMWREGVDPRLLRRMAIRLLRERDLGPADRQAFKDARARFKLLRFAFANLDARHAYPPAFDRLTRAMGQAQDALRNGRRNVAALRAIWLRLLLGRIAFRRVRKEVEDFRPSTPEGLRAHILAGIDLIRAGVVEAEVTGKEFHRLRKVVSRMVAFNDALRTLDPAPRHQAMSRYLATINGLMGDMHDTLVERRISGTQDYHADAFPLPDEIRRRLGALADRFGTTRPPA